jgi:hypothetical protein
MQGLLGGGLHKGASHAMGLGFFAYESNVPGTSRAMLTVLMLQLNNRV